MNKQREPMDSLLIALKERAKELKCLYQVEELLKNYDMDLTTIFTGVIEAIPPGLQYPDFCQARITYNDKEISGEGFFATQWVLSADITLRYDKIGTIEVFYTREMPQEDEGPFAKEEVRLVNTIAERLSDFILHMNLRQVMQDMQHVGSGNTAQETNEWRIVLDLSRRMDQDLYKSISRKMLNYLCWNGIKETNEILRQIGPDKRGEEEDESEGDNRPQQLRRNVDIIELSEKIFDIAERNLSGSEILSCVDKWMQEDRASFLIKTLVNLESSLGDISDVLRRFVHLSFEEVYLSDSTLKGARVALIRRLITDSLDYIKIAKNFAKIEDFYELIQRMVYPVGSHGLLGGKSAGLFLAWQILKKQGENDEDIAGIKIPKTWYVTSDGLHNFLHHNNLEEVIEQKYKEIGQVRQEYPHIIRLFKNSSFTPEIIQGLSSALDDFGDKPIIVRSSSLLEDRFGSSFSGKYKSLFLANQGSKAQRLQALLDAIAEVYSSTFGPDPIEYRAERELIDFKEEMGLIIQEVVGQRVGKYFLPAFAGVAFSANEFRWSPRIKREDGLIRMVPGLGTRAVDRLSDDYPILVAPGQPGLQVNVTTDEIIRYSPNKMDVINLENNSFETILISDFLKQYGEEYPAVTRLVSVVQDDQIKRPSFYGVDFAKDEIIVTFSGLIADTRFVSQVKKILDLLKESLGTPVDIEFASDGQHFYLLQCRPQSHSPDSAPASIPKDIPQKDILFTADRFISNGYIPDITHIVYVEPQRYSELSERSLLYEVGRVIGRLNTLLPKRQFILMGPGRWGSRGDIKLGVNVTYSDISNTSALIEIARRKGNYIPDLSFGTHFFQDLAEAAIRYLPLYPDNENIVFNERFLVETQNILTDILPEYASLEDVVRVIDVPRATNGKILRILMNADLDEAVGILTQPSSKVDPELKQLKDAQIPFPEDHWRWRLRMAERIASLLDAERFGVKAFYLIGSTKNATAGPGSNIDLLLHFSGNDKDKHDLLGWLEGWSLCLDEINYLRTGYRCGGLLAVHIITDEDIKSGSSYALKIDAVTDPAKEIPLKKNKPAIK